MLILNILFGSFFIIQESKASTSSFELNYTFNFKKPILHDISIFNKTFTQVQMANCISNGEPGTPSLPVYPVKLLVPQGKELKSIKVSCSNIIEVESEISEKPIFPQQQPISIGINNSNHTFLMNDNVYNSTDPIFDSLYDNIEIGFCRGYAIVSIMLNPVQYIPNTKKLYYYPEMTIKLNLRQTDKINPFFKFNNENEEWVKKLVFNSEETDTYNFNNQLYSFGYENGLCNASDEYDYVIITTTQNNLDDWVASESIPYNWTNLTEKHLSENNMNSTVVTVENITSCSDYWNATALFNDTAAQIREFIKDAYQDWNTSYVLIAGDDDLVPAREMDYSYESNVDSDLYWSNLDNTFNADNDSEWGESGDNGFDLYSEIYIGRLPCDTPQDVSNWMNKSFTYADSANQDLIENAAFYGGNTGWTAEGDDFVDYSAIKGTTNWLGPSPGSHGNYPSWLGFQYGFETWNEENPLYPFDLSVKWTAEPTNTGWQGGDEPSAINGLKNAINSNNVTLLSGMAHANAAMSLDVGASSWESDYHNTFPFFVHDYGCHVGDMDALDDGVLHSMLFYSDTSLAFATVFNTGYGWGSPSDTNSSSALQQKLFWDYFFDTTNNSGSTNNWQLGKAMAFSKDAMAPTINWDYIGTPEAWRAVIQGCLLFGDPAQKLRVLSTDNSIVISNTSPTNQSINNSIGNITLQASVNDPEGDTIDITFRTNATGSWEDIGSNNSQLNGTYYQNYNFENYNTTYWWSVNVSDITGGSGYKTETFNFKTRLIHNLTAPTLLTADMYNKTVINLSWMPGINSTHTYIERNTTNNWSKDEGTIIYNGTSTSFNDSNLTTDTTYYYQAWSWDNNDKIWSNENTSISNTTIDTLPITSDISPANQTEGVSISTSTITMLITDIDNDTFNWSIITIPDIGNNNSTNATSGIIQCNISDLSYNTNYTWNLSILSSVNDTWINSTYYFITGQQPSNDNSGNSNTNVIITTISNNQPSKPSITNGPSTGYIGTSYEFSSVGTDIDDDQIKYKFDWGDETTTEWSSFLSSKTEFIQSHSWSNTGDFNIKVKTKDENGAESIWSDSVTITINEVSISDDDDDSSEIIIEVPNNNTANSTTKFYISDITGYEEENLSFIWNFGDGNTSNEKIPNHIYEKPGTYTVILEIFDNNGNCIKSETYEIIIEEDIITEKQIENQSIKTDDDSITFSFWTIPIIGFFIILLYFIYKRQYIFFTRKPFENHIFNFDFKKQNKNKVKSYKIAPKKPHGKIMANYNYDILKINANKSEIHNVKNKFSESHDLKNIRKQVDKLNNNIDDILRKNKEK